MSPGEMPAVPEVPGAVVVDALADASPAPPPVAPPPPARGGLACLLAGLGTVLRAPGVLLFLHLILFLAALPLALPVLDSARDLLASRSGPWLGQGDWFREVPRVVLQEWQRESDLLGRALPVSLAPLLLLAGLLGLGVSAGWMGLATAPAGERAGLAAFLRHGGRFWFRFLRTWVLGLALLAGLQWLVWGPPGQAFLDRLAGRPFVYEEMPSESTARLLANAREVAWFVLLMLLELLLDLARASLVAGDRRSAFLALFRGLWLLLRRPGRVLAAVLSGLLLEALWVAALLALAPRVPGSAWFLVALLPLGRIALRGARHGALALLARDASPLAAAAPTI